MSSESDDPPPTAEETLACSKCVPTNRTYVKAIAYGMILLGIGIAVMIWFPTIPALIYVVFAFALLLAVGGMAQGFFLTLKCAPCKCS